MYGGVKGITRLAGGTVNAVLARAAPLLPKPASAPAREPELATLALMTAHEPAQLVLRLAPGTAVVASAYPVASIAMAHLEASPTLKEAGQRLRAGQGEAALVWRQGYQPRLRAALPGEAAFVAALLSGASLAAALDQAGPLDFSGWLGQAVHSGLLLAVAVVTATATTSVTTATTNGATP